MSYFEMGRFKSKYITENSLYLSQYIDANPNVIMFRKKEQGCSYGRIIEWHNDELVNCK